MTDQWFLDWVSPGRFATFLVATGRDGPSARRLYDWNARLSAAYLHDLAHLEVGLRNAYDRALLTAVVDGEQHWTDPRTMDRLFPVRAPGDAAGRRGDSNVAPRRKVDRTQIRDHLERLRRLRNRIAHHEPVLSGGHTFRRTIIDQVRRLSPDAARDLVARSEVEHLLRTRPRTGRPRGA